MGRLVGIVLVAVVLLLSGCTVNIGVPAEPAAPSVQAPAAPEVTPEPEPEPSGPDEAGYMDYLKINAPTFWADGETEALSFGYSTCGFLRDGGTVAQSLLALANNATGARAVDGAAAISASVFYLCPEFDFDEEEVMRELEEYQR